MKIFVSSTPEDLYKYRKATIAAIRKLKLRPINMDNTDSQLDAIQKADVFIKIYSSSSSSTETTEPSLTEQEYEEANKYNIHCLSYDIDETYEPKKLFKTIGGDLSNWRKRQSIKTAESSPQETPTPVHEQERRINWALVGGIIALLSLIVAIIAVIFQAMTVPEVRNLIFTLTPTPIATPLEASPAAEGELVIVVAYGNPESGEEIDLTHVIESLTDKPDEVRVIVVGHPINSHEQAQEIGQIYDAIMVVYNQIVGGNVVTSYQQIEYTNENRISPLPTATPLPDSDNDGVPDIYDNCPNVPGIRTNGGCPRPTNTPIPTNKPIPTSTPLPDSDNDGVPDTYDNCPNIPGIRTNGGCPSPTSTPIPTNKPIPTSTPFLDSDNDGVPNMYDNCPYTYGTQANGCPILTNTPIPTSTPLQDRDNDGVADIYDNCPNTYGTQANGCPLATNTPTAISNTVAVFANSPWQSTNITVQAGDRLVIQYTGTDTWTNNTELEPFFGPDSGGSMHGCCGGECVEPLACYPQGGLVGRIAYGIPFAVGSNYNQVVSSSGLLELRINDADIGLFDNAGSVTMTISVYR